MWSVVHFLTWGMQSAWAESKLRPGLTPDRQKEGTLYLQESDIFVQFVSSAHTKKSTNSNYGCISWWETLLEWRWAWNATGLCCSCREISSKRFLFFFYQSRFLKLAKQGTKHRETTSMWSTMLQASSSYTELLESCSTRSALILWSPHVWGTNYKNDALVCFGFRTTGRI